LVINKRKRGGRKGGLRAGHIFVETDQKKKGWGLAGKGEKWGGGGTVSAGGRKKKPAKELLHGRPKKKRGVVRGKPLRGKGVVVEKKESRKEGWKSPGKKKEKKSLIIT